MTEWPTTTIESSLERLTLNGLPKVLARDYQQSGAYPIVDQGQGLIAGWTEDDSGLISNNLPLVVFGDHTRTFKYVDFPFVRGADGTQLMKPKTGFDPLFFYYACRAIDLPNRGYNRHFTMLKEKEIPTPPLWEQRSIARVLCRIDDALLVQAKQLEVSSHTKRAAMQTLFTRGLRGEARKETEIGPVPESWEVGQLGKFADIISTRMAYTELEKADPTDSEDAVKVQGIKVADMNLLGNETELEAAILERMVDKCHAEYLCAPPGTIIFPKRGAAIATNKKRISTQWTAFDPNVIGVAPREGIERRFLFQWFQMFDLRTITDLGPTPQLNKKNLLPVIVPVPPTDEQHEIAAILDAIDRKIDLHRRKRAVLEELFQSLLHKLMTGEIRVGELNLSILSRRFPNLLEPPRR